MHRQLIAEWLERPGSRGKCDSTVRSYESLLRTHSTPAIGGLPMALLTTGTRIGEVLALAWPASPCTGCATGPPRSWPSTRR